MNGATPIDDQLLAKYIAGEADTAEQAVVRSWVAASPVNAEELERMRAVWDLGSEAEADVHVEQALAKVQQRIAAAEGRGRVIPFTRHLRWVAAAAVLMGVVFAARWWFTQDVQRFASGATFSKERLADGSRVELSPGTRMDVRIGHERKVTLEGEAYFEVTKDKEHPFMIDVDGVEVTVLGTAFTVDAFDTARWVLVRVREGRVQVVASNDTVVIGAGEHAGYDRQLHKLESVVAPPFEVWGERIIHFEDAPLEQVVIELEKMFPVNIHLANADIARCHLTATFEEEPIERILSVIAETYSLTLTRSADGRYELDGDGCP